MAKLCGQLNQLSNWHAEKARAIFGEILIGNTRLKNIWVANQTLAGQISEGANVGEHVCLYYFRHMLTKKIIIGLKPDSRPLIGMERKGLLGGFVWYVIFSPFMLGIPWGIVGYIVGAFGGNDGSSVGWRLGVLYALVGSWFSYFRMVGAYRAMLRDAAAAQPLAACA